MGQMTYAIMYGVEEDDGERWSGEDGDGGIIGAFRKHCKPKIDARASKLHSAPWNVAHRFVPDYTSGDTDLRAYGFWIAVGGSGERGIPDLASVAFNAASVRANYTESYARAKRRWRRFAKWCAAEGHALDKARLWLVQTEVA